MKENNRINTQVWVLQNEQGDFFTGCEFSPNFTAALLYADADGAERDRNLYKFDDCNIQSVFCLSQDEVDAHDVEVTKRVCKEFTQIILSKG